MKYLAFALALSVALWAGRAGAQSFTTFVRFTPTGGTASGSWPLGNLTVSGSTLYGMTWLGGAAAFGNVFSVGEDGTNFHNLVSFTGTSGTAVGKYPENSLILSGSTLYGMTSEGGATGILAGKGNVFSVNVDGTNFQNLVSFTGTGGAVNGDFPLGSLLQNGSTLYGMTYAGGAGGNGNVFSVAANGTNYRNLLSFTGTGGAASGQRPDGSLLQSGGTLYGMTQSGGAGGNGNVFAFAADGTAFQNLVSFTGTGGAASGQYPDGNLIQSGSTLYGMTQSGGAGGNGNVFSVATDGTNYQNVLSFTGTGGAASGLDPLGSLLLSGTTLYGMTSSGGAAGWGNVFSVGIDGSGYTNLYSFSGGADGGQPYGDLTVSGGTLFGMTRRGGISAQGTVFALTLPTPEPGTLALVGCGAAALVTYRWRRGRPRGRQEH